MRSVVVVLPCDESAPVLPIQRQSTHRIDVGDNAYIADALNPGLVVRILAAVCSDLDGLEGQLGIFQHQYGQLTTARPSNTA